MGGEPFFVVYERVGREEAGIMKGVLGRVFTGEEAKETDVREEGIALQAVGLSIREMSVDAPEGAEGVVPDEQFMFGGG